MRKVYELGIYEGGRIVRIDSWGVWTDDATEEETDAEAIKCFAQRLLKTITQSPRGKSAL